MTPAAVVEACSSRLDITPAEFGNPRRMGPDHLEARALACWVLKHGMGLSLKEISRELNYYDYQAPSKHVRRVNDSPRLLAQARAILASLKGNPQ